MPKRRRDGGGVLRARRRDAGYDLRARHVQSSQKLDAVSEALRVLKLMGPPSKIEAPSDADGLSRTYVLCELLPDTSFTNDWTGEIAVAAIEVAGHVFNECR